MPQSARTYLARRSLWTPGVTYARGSLAPSTNAALSEPAVILPAFQWVQNEGNTPDQAGNTQLWPDGAIQSVQ
jgi:hypothetical protein